MKKKRTSHPSFQPGLLSPLPSAKNLRSPLRCSATAPLPLLSPNSHVLITAPAAYAARLAPSLISANLRPIWAPAIRTEALTDAEEIASLQSALLNLPSYAVLAFTSRTGMKQVGHHLLELANHDSELSALLLKGSGVRIAALGRDATAAMDCLGVSADLVPLTASPDGLVQFLAADESLRGTSVLCPVPTVKGIPEPPVVPEFLSALKQSGFDVTALPAYETRAVKRQVLRREVTMLENGGIDAVAFSSAGEAYALATALTEQERANLVERVRAGEIILAAHGPFTAQGVRDALGDVEVSVSADFSSFDGLVKVLVQAFMERERQSGRLVMPG